MMLFSSHLGSASIDTEVSSLFGILHSYEQQKITQFVNWSTTNNGVNKMAINKLVKPTDSGTDWRDVANFPTESLLNYKIDIYSGPAGSGYIISASYKDVEGEHVYFEHIGPETYRDRGEKIWTLIPPKIL